MKTVIDRKDVTFSTLYEPCMEDFSRGHFDDESCVEWIRDQFKQGNEWAWFDVLITCEYKGYKGFASLGCCSYESQANFEAFELDNLKDEAFDNLKATIENSIKSVTEKFPLDVQRII